jgi:hypothetical protein
MTFLEESQHNLAYYCTDILGNAGPIDDEKFKVEGFTFTINLNKKWNLISVPFVLQNNAPEHVFRDIQANIISVWAYDPTHGMCGQDWCMWSPGSPSSLTIMPGWGYWVLTKRNTSLVLGGSLFSPGVTPPSKTIVRGWNLIGYYGNANSTGQPIYSYNGPVGAGKEPSCMLQSLVDTTLGYPLWSALMTYWEPYNPNPWVNINFTGRMDPGAGYWIEIDTDEVYSPSITCAA